MPSKIYKFDIYLIFLFLLGLFHLVANIIWINLNKVPFSWDPAGHTIIAFRFTDFFTIHTPENFLSISDYYPPFVHLVVTFFMLIFGKNILIGPLVVTGFFLAAIIFIYFYTVELFKDKYAGLIAALLFSFLPNMYALSRQFLLEMPLLAMALGSLFFLEKSDYFQNRKHTVFFAIFLSLALAIKWNIAIFLFIPIVVKLIRKFPDLAWKNLIITLGIVLLNLPWYIYNLPIILHAVSFTSTPEAADPQQIFSYESIKFYLFMITNLQLTWLGMVAFIVSVVYFLKKQRNYLLFTYLFVYLVLTFIGNKDLRYVIFLAPIAVIVIAYFLAKLRHKLAVQILTAVLIFYYIFYYFSLSFGLIVNPKEADFRHSIEIPAFGWVDLINLGKDTGAYLAPIFDQTVWPNSVIATEMSKHIPQKQVKILVLCEKPYFNQVDMELERRKLGFDKIQFFAPYELPPFASNELLEQYLLSFDVMLVAHKNLGFEGGIRYYAALKQIASYLEENQSPNLTKINEYPLPDGDQLNVYKPTQDLP